MQIFYDDRKTQRLFDSGKAILKNFGLAVGKRVMQRMTELEAAQSLQMLVIGRVTVMVIAFAAFHWLCTEYFKCVASKAERIQELAKINSLVVGEV